MSSLLQNVLSPMVKIHAGPHNNSHTPTPTNPLTNYIKVVPEFNREGRVTGNIDITHPEHYKNKSTVPALL